MWVLCGYRQNGNLHLQGHRRSISVARRSTDRTVVCAPLDGKNKQSLDHCFLPP